MRSPLRVTVPPVLVDRVGDVPGVRFIEWDLHEAPEDPSGIDVVVFPPSLGDRSWPRRLGELPHLRVLQLPSAGYDHAVDLLPPGVTLCNAVGVHDTATSEMALTLMLAAQRSLPDTLLAQGEGRWERLGLAPGLAGRRVLVVGYGGIGRALAARLRACEADVVAVASRPRPGDDLVPRVHGAEDLDALLPECDVVALTLPYSDRTRHTLDARALALLPDGALVVNVARGGVLDTDALVGECASGRLRAALDVTDPEPLPTGHPLWSIPGVIVTPHLGGATRIFAPRLAELVRRQVEAIAAGRAPQHVVATG